MKLFVFAILMMTMFSLVIYGGLKFLALYDKYTITPIEVFMSIFVLSIAIIIIIKY